MSTDANEAALQPEDFDELDAMLDAMREQDEDVPQWEFCEGFMAALICNRRVIMPSEYMPVLFGEQKFADEQQAARFMSLWTRRWNEIATALNKEDIEGLDDEAAYHPEVLDVRGSLAAMPPEERAEFDDESIPSFGQVWALGFLAAVDHWSEDWAAPRDKESAEWLEEALAAIEELAEADPGEPEIAPFGEGPPSVSEARIAQFGDAIWAVYDLRQLWRSLGPKVEPARKAEEPGRNDLCPCGSGKKYKKCHGAH